MKTAIISLLSLAPTALAGGIIYPLPGFVTWDSFRFAFNATPWSTPQNSTSQYTKSVNLRLQPTPVTKATITHELGTYTNSSQFTALVALPTPAIHGRYYLLAYEQLAYSSSGQNSTRMLYNQTFWIDDPNATSTRPHPTSTSTQVGR